MDRVNKGNFRNIVLSFILMTGIIFSVVFVVNATAPNPGHNFTEISGGMAQGDLLYGSGADTLSALAKNATASRYLSNSGSSNNPAWAQVDLSNGVTGTLADGNLTSALTGKTYNALTLTSQSVGFTIAGGTTSKTLTLTGDATISGNPLSNPMTTLGDVIYGGSSGVSTRLAGAAGFLKSTGSAAPAWSAVDLASSDATGVLPLANGGTAANITASNGGICYSTSSALAILAGTSTANKVLMSGSSAAPSWSAPTFPNASATTRKIIVSDGTNWVASTETYAVPGGTAGNIMAGDGTNWTSAAGPGPTYNTILNAACSHIAAKVAGTYAIGMGDPCAVSGTGTLYPLALINYVAADYPTVAGVTTKLRVRATISVNGTAPTGNFTVGLYPVTSGAGAAGLKIYTMGTLVSSSATTTVTAPAASSMTSVASADFTPPSNGVYALAVVTTATVATSSLVEINATLQQRN